LTSTNIAFCAPVAANSIASALFGVNPNESQKLKIKGQKFKLKIKNLIPRFCLVPF